MAIDYIKVDSSNAATATQAVFLKDYARQLRVAYDLGKKVRATMTHMHDGVDFTGIETLFGLPVGTGQAVFDLVNGSIGSMEGQFQVDDAVELTERIV